MQIRTYVALYVTVVDFTAFLGVLTYVPLCWAKCHKNSAAKLHTACIQAKRFKIVQR